MNLVPLQLGIEPILDVASPHCQHRIVVVGDSKHGPSRAAEDLKRPVRRYGAERQDERCSTLDAVQRHAASFHLFCGVLALVGHGDPEGRRLTASPVTIQKLPTFLHRTASHGMGQGDGPRSVAARIQQHHEAFAERVNGGFAGNAARLVPSATFPLLPRIQVRFADHSWFNAEFMQRLTSAGGFVEHMSFQPALRKRSQETYDVFGSPTRPVDASCYIL